MTFYVVHICLGFEQVLQEKVLETNWRFVGGQCDQMVRLCVQYLAIYNHENCQRLFKIHRSGQIWSQWWWTQTWSPLTRCFKPSQWVQLALVDSRQFIFWTFKICNLQAQSRLISAPVVVIVGQLQVAFLSGTMFKKVSSVSGVVSFEATNDAFLFAQKRLTNLWTLFLKFWSNDKSSKRFEAV